MLDRNILIIDDNSRIETIYIPAYLKTINSLKATSEKWAKYNFTLMHCPSMKAALDYLSDPRNYVDVLVVDYDFNGETTFSNGTAFVNYIREKINRFCQIVFYSMQGTTSIEIDEWAALVNSDVYQFVDKSDDTSVMGKVIFDAATRRNPIVESLERFWCQYGALLNTYNYKVGGADISFEEIICHIRMDDETGRAFIEKLLRKAILLSTEI